MIAPGTVNWADAPNRILTHHQQQILGLFLFGLGQLAFCITMAVYVVMH